MNRVQRFAEQDDKKRNNVGLALQTLRQRLTSSSAAIDQSRKRRRERLEPELTEAKLARMGGHVACNEPSISDEILNNADEHDQDEVDERKDLTSTGAATAETVQQVQIEVQTLKGLEIMAIDVLRSGKETKSTQIDRVLDETGLI